MKRATKKLMTAFVLLCMTLVASAQQQPQTPPLPVDANVRIGKLDNGLTYYIRHNELPENQADFYIAQKVGSILEEEDQRGLAHFLEHMCFNGTTNFPGKGIINYLETIGVRFGENLNAYTSIDETVYMIKNVPANKEGAVDSCLLILHDWANDLTLADKEIDAERGVIHEEWRQGQGAMMRMYEKVLPQVYKDSKYGHRLPIGTIEVIDNFPYQTLRDYYEKWYRPDQQGIIVVGDIDVDQVEAKIKEMFSPIEMPENAAERIYETVADNDEPIVTIATDKEQTSTLIYLWHKRNPYPKEQKGQLNYLLYNYLNSMAASMLNTRLAELTMSAEPPFVNASTGMSEFLVSATKSAFVGSAISKDNGIPTALSAITREIERMRQFGFTEAEYARSKANYLRSLESGYNERDKKKNGQYVQECLNNFLNNDPLLGIENLYAIMNQVVPNIPLEVINNHVKGLISDKNIVINIFGPEKEGITYPTEEELLNIWKQAKAEELTPYVDKLSDEKLLDEKPEAGKVIKTEEGAFGSTVWTLSNGIRVIMKTTDFKADEIQMYAFSPGGTSIFGTDEPLQTSVINNVTGLGGLGKFSQVDLGKVLAGKKVGIGTYINQLSEGISGSCSPKDFETLMQLAYLSFTAPRMDNDAFTSFKTRLQASLINQEANPMVAFSDSAQHAVYGDHPLNFRLKADMVKDIDYNRIMEMYNDRFKDASDFTFLFVGNINPEEVKPFIETYLGGLPTIQRKESFQDLGMDIRKGKIQNVFEKEMETAKATILLCISGDTKHNLKNSLIMTIIKQCLDMVYTEEVREKEGGTYGVGVSGQLSSKPGEKVNDGILQISFETDPEKREHLVGIVLKELNKMAKEGPKEEHIAKVKEFLEKSFNEKQKENSYWLNTLNTYYWKDMDMNSNYLKTLNDIKAKDIKKFLKALLKQGNQIEVVMTCNEKK